MTAIDEWHVSDHELERYATHSIPVFARASVEAHLLECARCRAQLDVAVSTVRPPNHTDDVWAGIVDRIDVSHRPRRSSTTALDVSLASPPLIMATTGLAAGLIVMMAIVEATAPRAAAPLFLALAPLTPVVGALLAFQTGIDPAGRLALATPLAAGRLPLLRALVASLTSIVAVVVASVFVPRGVADLALWLLPGAALATTAVAVATWIDPKRVVVILMGAWLALVNVWLLGSRAPDVRLNVDDLAISRPSVQLVLLGVTMIASAIGFLRRNELPDWRAR